MVISQVIGGLGNQMFQYAVGRALSLKKSEELKLDVSGFAHYGLHHGFELQRVFNCPAELADKSDVCGVLGWQSWPLVSRIVSRPRYAVLRRNGFIVEPNFQYWPDINQAPQDCYLVGYWQSEKYFIDNASTIRSDFIFRPPLDTRNKELAAAIGEADAASLHIRRGDYVKNPQTYAVHGVCSLDYYCAAVKYIAERVHSPHFFVFSDDIAWARENLKISFPCQFIGHNQGINSYIDMQLMSLCKHHIIANSSFSWWGAWLNPSLAKIVVAPEKWFADGSAVDDLFPQGWVKL